MTLRRATLGLVPILALTIAVPFVNRLDPTIFGLPFVLFWVVGWVFATPLFLWFVGRVEGRW